MKTRKILWKRAAALSAALLMAAALSACSQKEPESDAASNQVSTAVVNSNVFPEGASIGGKNISGKTVDEALAVAKDALDEVLASMEISVKFKDDTISLKGADFATQDILDLVLPDMLKSAKAEKYELPFVTDLSEQGKQKLQEAAKVCMTQAKDASIEKYDTDSGEFVFTEEQKGVRVDMTATLQSVRQLLAQKHGGAIQAAFVETVPKVTKAHLQENFKQLSTYSTVSNNNSNGNSNMALALSHVNGTILKPGEEFSYNDTIGDSTDPANGWLPAGGLAGGLSVMTYGGGICQGSTTLYNAAMMAGMEVIERDCHAVPSGYCPIGLDATVDYGSIDFRFRNALKNPVYIAAWMDGVTLTVKFYGCFPEEWDDIELDSEMTGSEPPRSTVEFRVDSSLAKGQFVRKSSGNTGYYASAWRTFYKNGQEVKTEALPNSYYGSTGMIFAVGEGTDTSKIDTSQSSGTVGGPSPSPSPTPEPSSEPTPTPEPSYEPTPTPEPPIDPEPSEDPGEDPGEGPGEDPGDENGEDYGDEDW